MSLNDITPGETETPLDFARRSAASYRAALHAAREFARTALSRESHLRAQRMAVLDYLATQDALCESAKVARLLGSTHYPPPTPAAMALPAPAPVPACCATSTAALTVHHPIDTRILSTHERSSA